MNDERAGNAAAAMRVFLLIGVTFTATVTAIRQYAAAYQLIEPSYEYSLIAAFMVVGAVVLAMLFPTTSRVAFPMLAGSLIMAAGIIAALRLGLADYSPLLFRYAVAGMVAAGIGGTLPLLRSFVTPFRPAETAPKPLPTPKLDRKLLGFGTRVKVSKPKPQAKLTDGSGNETDDDALLYHTLATLRGAGKVSDAAAALGVSPAAVNKRLKRLYAKDPAAVEDSAPDWVERNMGAKV